MTTRYKNTQPNTPKQHTNTRSQTYITCTTTLILKHIHTHIHTYTHSHGHTHRHTQKKMGIQTHCEPGLTTLWPGCPSLGSLWARRSPCLGHVATPHSRWRTLGPQSADQFSCHPTYSLWVLWHGGKRAGHSWLQQPSGNRYVLKLLPKGCRQRAPSLYG